MLVQGGEPLLRPDLMDILEDLSSLGLQVTVITNGTRLTTDLVARFASLRLPLSVSLVIPVYNEERALPATLRQLFEQAGTYEVIVVDGGSHDRTCEIVRCWPVNSRLPATLSLLTAPKGRASQMRVGKWPWVSGCSSSCRYTVAGRCAESASCVGPESGRPGRRIPASILRIRLATPDDLMARQFSLCQEPYYLRRSSSIRAEGVVRTAWWISRSAHPGRRGVR